MSVKKKTSSRRSAKAEVEVAGTTQSAAERRSAEAVLKALITKFAPANLRLIGAMRKSLQTRLPTAREVVYEYENLGAVVISFSPSGHGHDGALGIRADAEGVRLYFNGGKTLPDPEKLLQGSANVRWIEMEGASTLTRPAVVRLIDEAIARNRVPFAPPHSGAGAGAAGGSVVIRSTAKKSGAKRK